MLNDPVVDRDWARKMDEWKATFVQSSFVAFVFLFSIASLLLDFSVLVPGYLVYDVCVSSCAGRLFFLKADRSRTKLTPDELTTMKWTITFRQHMGHRELWAYVVCTS